MCEGFKHFNKTAAAAEYHIRGLLSTVVLVPKGDASDDTYPKEVI